MSDRNHQREKNRENIDTLEKITIKRKYETTLYAEVSAKRSCFGSMKDLNLRAYFFLFMLQKRKSGRLIPERKDDAS